MKNYKKILAAGLAVSMVMGNSVIALADDMEGGTSGTGGLEGTVSTDVFSVVLPSVPETGDATFNYILDPEGLIAKAGSDKYTGKTFEENATLFFANTAADAANNYSSVSDALTVVNKSSSNVTVEVKATVASIDGITMSGDKTFKDDTKTSLYLALKDANNETAITAEGGATLTSTINAAASDAYEIKWNTTDSKYENVLTEAAKKDDYTGFSKYTFQMTGACNAAGDWSDLTDTAPVVNVVWSVKDPFITGPQISMNNSGLITVTGLTAEQNYESVKIVVGDGSEWDANDEVAEWNTDSWSSENGGEFTIQLGSGWIDFINGKGGTAKAIINYTGGSAETSVITFSTENGN